MQAYYSIAGRELERDIIPMAQDQGLGILIWSPLAGGLLSGKFKENTSGPEGARRTTFDFPPVDRQRAFRVLEAMRPIAAAYNVSVARVALAWVLQQPAITSVIIGATSQDQLADNLAAGELHLSDADLAALDAVSALPREYPGWMFERQLADRLPS